MVIKKVVYIGEPGSDSSSNVHQGAVVKRTAVNKSVGPPEYGQCTRGTGGLLWLDLPQRL